VVLLGRLDPVCLRPEVVTAHAICGGCIVFVPLLLVSAGVAVVLCANWMMSLGPAIAANVSDDTEFISTSKTTAGATIYSSAITSAAIILLVGNRFQ
jgi:hypothetical protein